MRPQTCTKPDFERNFFGASMDLNAAVVNRAESIQPGSRRRRTRVSRGLKPAFWLVMNEFLEIRMSDVLSAAPRPRLHFCLFSR
jgi:hypothetical protein